MNTQAHYTVEADSELSLIHRSSAGGVQIETARYVAVKWIVLWAAIPDVVAPKPLEYRSGNKIASRMRRKRREPRMEGNAPDHLPSGTRMSTRASGQA